MTKYEPGYYWAQQIPSGRKLLVEVTSGNTWFVTGMGNPLSQDIYKITGKVNPEPLPIPRESGYYKVKKNSGPWVVAFYDSMTDTCNIAAAYGISYYKPYELAEIGDRIEFE